MKTIDISRALAIGGWMSARELRWLAVQATTNPDIVEFGSLHGRSSRALADHTDGKIWCVDPWRGDYYTEDGNTIPLSTYVYPYFISNMYDHINSDKCIPIRGFSYSFELDRKVDMVFIDGDHRYETVVKDIKKGLDLLKSGGLLCGHDYGHPNWPGVKQAVDELLSSDVEVEETIWWTLKP